MNQSDWVKARRGVRLINAWEDARAEYAILQLEGAHYCGYCTFPHRPVKEAGYGGILTYVPVHGGITLAEEHDDGCMTYGFDCGHSGDDADPRTRDPEWLAAECHKMFYAILIAAGFEDGYLAAENDEQRAVILDDYHRQLAEVGITFELRDNFGALINVMFGKL